MYKQIQDCFERGGKILICGNGGSASQANHFAAEFVCKYKKERIPLPAISLAANQSVITAIANDFSYDMIFSRQIAALGNEGDILITLSTSGKSKNILKAIKTAELLGLEIIDFPRKGKDVGEIQNNQLKLMHIICDKIEQAYL